ncbi:hypothetical protein B0H17DRAFT_1336823 [Mycena rosella]|uniref:Uncharacterized protein n=1 Tax=Mycena rosella TaxID=1033263 RepID=A0AAD7CXX3_MYCRO|nr:hypothetical protein B0H17DRAFT_1336823 [Mycena rosella]
MYSFIYLAILVASSAMAGPSTHNARASCVHCGTTQDATLSDCQALVTTDTWNAAWSGKSNACHWGLGNLAYNVACHGNCCTYFSIPGGNFPNTLDRDSIRNRAASLLGCGDSGKNKINGLQVASGPDNSGVCLSNGDGCGDCFDNSDFTGRHYRRLRPLQPWYISVRFSTSYRATIGADSITKSLPPPPSAPPNTEPTTLKIWGTAGPSLTLSGDEDSDDDTDDLPSSELTAHLAPLPPPAPLPISILPAFARSKSRSRPPLKTLVVGRVACGWRRSASEATITPARLSSSSSSLPSSPASPSPPSPSSPSSHSPSTSPLATVHPSAIATSAAYPNSGADAGPTSSPLSPLPYAQHFPLGAAGVLTSLSLSANSLGATLTHRLRACASRERLRLRERRHLTTPTRIPPRTRPPSLFPFAFSHAAHFRTSARMGAGVGDVFG